MKRAFTVATETVGKKDSKTIIVGKQFTQYIGEYEIREISAQEGIDAVNILIAQTRKLQEDLDQIKPEELRKKQIEKATTVNGKPLVISDLSKFPNKIWQVLVAANEILNGVSIEEARFLLQPSGQNEKPSIQQ